jgi:formiminotetrahydrofolate cyclodeaminase
MAASLAERGNPNLRGDAVTGALLAEPAVRAGARLVAINLSAAGIEDDRLRCCEEFVAQAAASTSRVGDE